MWWESDTLPCYYYLDRQLCSTTLPMGESPIQFQLKTTYIVDATLQAKKEFKIDLHVRIVC